MDCLNSIGTRSLLIGPAYVFTVDGSGWFAASSGCASENDPLTRRPGALLLGSDTVSAASPAVEITLAVVDAV